MHRSGLQAIVVDCDDIEAGERFWTGALGIGVTGRKEPYVELEPISGTVRFLLQHVSEAKGAKSRVHLDIETDDVDAEVRRLERLGARRSEQVEGWWIMRDPCGNEFCVVPAKPEWFDSSANIWDEE